MNKHLPRQNRIEEVLVVNYESAWRLEAELLKWALDIIIADEGHKIKTHNIAASKALHRLGAKAKYRLLLTGTVITNKPVDVFSQYKFADPRVYGPSFYLFRNRYFDMTGYGNHTPVMKRSMELMQRHINTNARVAMDQEEYARQYGEYEARFHEARQRIADVEAQREAMTAKRGQIMVYLDTLKAQGLVRSFDEALWYGTVEQVRVTQDGKLRFIFKDGTEIEG